MKRSAVVLFLAFVILGDFYGQAQAKVAYDLFGGTKYENGKSKIEISVTEGGGLLLVGTVDSKGAGYVIESNNLALENKRRITIRMSGITQSSSFDSGKLLKLEINNKPLITSTLSMRNRNESDFINARDGECTFDISAIGNILKINFVLFNCAINGVKVEMFTE